MDSELKPCPFCGGEAEVIRPDGMEYVVECFACSMSGALRDTEAEAIAAWNTRALEQREAGSKGREGFVLVPRVPTIKMHNAAALGGLCGKPPTINEDGRIVWELADPSAIYRAMIAAAPSGEG